MIRKSDLIHYSIEELKENHKRLTETISDLNYCLDTLQESKDEENSSNEMYKQALTFLKSSQTQLKTKKSLAELTSPKAKKPKTLLFPSTPPAKPSFLSPRKFVMSRLNRPD